MKKLFFGASALLIGTISVYALSNNFDFDSSKLTFSSNSKTSNIVSNFDNSYNLSYSITDENEELKNKITELSKKTTSLLLGDIGSSEESNEHYYNRHKEYQELAAYNYFPRDSNSSSGYDESIENYQYVIASELAIPQLFNSFNELGVVYNSYGDIRVTINGNLAISMVLLPDVKIKEENKDNPEKYDYKIENLVIYYYFIDIDGEYRLCYLYGEYGEEVEKYFSELENSESKDTKALVSSYNSTLSSLYNFNKLNALSSETMDSIYNKNIDNLVYITSYYNNKLVNSANGFFINDGITYDDFISYIGNVNGTIIEKSSYSTKYVCVSSDGGYLNATFSNSTGKCTLASGMVK